MQELFQSEGNLYILWVTFWRLPLLYMAMLAVRGLCIVLFNPLFRLAGARAPFDLFLALGCIRGLIAMQIRPSARSGCKPSLVTSILVEKGLATRHPRRNFAALLHTGHAFVHAEGVQLELA